MRLLAKSRKEGVAEVTLAEHTRDVMTAARIILETVGTRALDRCGLNGQREADDLRTLVLFAAFIHDWGKASEHFQTMLTHRDSVQLIRHEALSAVLANSHPLLTPWLADARCFQNSGVWLLKGAIIAAAGHHLKFCVPRSDRTGPVRDQGAGLKVRVFLGHPDFRDALLLGQTLGLAGPPILKDEVWRYDDDEEDATQEIHAALLNADTGLLGRRFQREWWQALSQTQQRLVALAKAWVVAADVAASAIAREDCSLETWLPSALLAEPSAEGLREVVRERLNPEEPSASGPQSASHKSLRPFQIAIAESSSTVTIVEAGCGTGKTLAAYAWAEARGRAGQGGKLFFAYPTTGTATEGFIDYVARRDSVESRLIHGRSSVDVADLLSTHEDEGGHEQIKAESLRDLGTEVIVCTVDTVLGLIQNQRRGLFISPAISCGRFVFDEVHAYDDRLFAALLDFLRTFPCAPVLLMSASVPRARRMAIEAVTGRLPEMPRPVDVESIPRYLLRPASSVEDAWRGVRETLSSHGKVLWVANTVARAASVGRRAHDEGIPAVVYHSRYRYEDRVRKHRKAVDAFAEGRPASLVVATQVAEMSLDLSADLLVTEMAPVPALIQRMGRLKRRATPAKPGNPGQALLVEVNSPRPYLEPDVQMGRGFWDRAVATGRALSQSDLRELMRAAASSLSSAESEAPGYESMWLDAGVESVPGVLREGEATMTVLLERDKNRILSAAKEGHQKLRDDILRCAVPILARPEAWGWERLAQAPLYPIAPTNRVAYDEDWGASWVDGRQNGGANG